MMNFDFTGRVAVLTGAASGMGFLTAECYVRAGGSVVMADIDPVTLEQKVALINEIREGAAVGVVCDVRDYSQICHVRDVAVETYGRIDLAVPYAGGAEGRMLKIPKEQRSYGDMPIEALDWSIDVNLKGQIYLGHAVFNVMRAQRSGVIVHIGSITGEEGDNGGASVGYSAAKSAAMNGLTKSVAQHGAPYGIRCVCVAPGPVLTRDSMANMQTALGRAADPREIVDLVLYLASPEGSFFNGVNLLMDGGRNIMPDKKNGIPRKE